MRVALGDLDRARRDAGISLRRLAEACGVSQPYLSQVFAGDREPSIAVLTAVSSALGGDLSVRFYPTTGPAIHDRLQAPDRRGAAEDRQPVVGSSRSRLPSFGRRAGSSTSC